MGAFIIRNFILILFLFSTIVHAGGLGDALRIVCNPMPKPDFYNCVNALRGHTYFEIAPLKICSSMISNSVKSDCVKTIGDITYNEEEIKECNGKITDDDKEDCLIQLGHNYFPEP